jgi:hypothetical protein
MVMVGMEKLLGKVAESQPAVLLVHDCRLMVVTCAGQPAVQATRSGKLTVPPGIKLVVEGPAYV